MADDSDSVRVGRGVAPRPAPIRRVPAVPGVSSPAVARDLAGKRFQQLIDDPRVRLLDIADQVAHVVAGCSHRIVGRNHRFPPSGAQGQPRKRAATDNSQGRRSDRGEQAAEHARTQRRAHAIECLGNDDRGRCVRRQRRLVVGSGVEGSAEMLHRASVSIELRRVNGRFQHAVGQIVNGRCPAYWGWAFAVVRRRCARVAHDPRGRCPVYRRAGPPCGRVPIVNVPEWGFTLPRLQVGCSLDQDRLTPRMTT